MSHRHGITKGPHHPASSTLPVHPPPFFNLACHPTAPLGSPTPSAQHNLPVCTAANSLQNLLLLSCGNPKNAIPRTQLLISWATGIRVIATANNPNSHNNTSQLSIVGEIHHLLTTSHVCPQTSPDANSSQGLRDPPWTLLARR